MADWDAAQYLKFEDERTRPARDLVAQVPLKTVRRAFDLGCGPGNSTEVVLERYPDAQMTGLDSSPDMLEKARKRLPNVAFEQADLRTWAPPSGVDLLYSNAVFQWVPNSIAVMGRLLQALPKGGVLAVQTPDNLDEPSHRIMREVAADGPWARILKDAHASREPRAPVEVFYDQLRPHCRHFDIWHTFYQHPLDGAGAIVEWLKGTGLRPFVDPLPDDDRKAFLAEYKSRIEKAYPPRVDGKSLLRFPRLFLVAVR